MKYLLFAAVFLSCASSQPAVNPVIQYVHDTTTVTKHDTARIPVPYLLTIPDTSVPYVTLSPSPTGDDWAQVEAAVNYCISHHIHKIRFTAGTFQFSRPVIVADTTGGIYHQVSICLEGVCPAMNTPAAWTTNFISKDPKTFSIGIQQGKGCQVENICFTGPYSLAAGLSQLQIDTLPFAAWDDGKCSTNVTSPNAAICIDPFSDPADYDSTRKMYEGLEAYYLPGMSQSGSTDVRITDCSFSGFVTGIIVSPGFQENGEMVKVEDCAIHNCRSAYSFTNAQQKTNILRRLEVWGGVHTILDGGTYGAHRGDGATCPVVDGINIAGYNYQLINGGSYTFPIAIKDVYSEGLYKIGTAGGFAGTCFEDCTFDLQWGPGIPARDFIYSGINTTWLGCLFRYYGNSTDRMVFNNASNLFVGGAFGTVPVTAPLQPVNAAMTPASFSNVSIYYTGQVKNGMDSTK